MSFRLRKANTYTAGDRKVDTKESVISNLSLKVHKFTPRQRPKDKRNVIILPLFSEFGCETLAPIYCLPKVLEKCQGKYTVVMGWHGREYFYRHLVDEFWELPEEHMWLREYARAFHHVSRNIKRLEKEAKQHGNVVDVAALGNVVVFPRLEKCIAKGCGGSLLIDGDNQVCDKCQYRWPGVGLFHRMQESRSAAVWLPDPSPEKMARAKKHLPPRAVGVTARWRKTWGRNLQPVFYERLIYMLEDMGYNPVWLGEKVTTLPCPIKRIVDYSISEDAKDLETTLALVKQMEFTVQLWTASSRLAAIMGTPYIIVESPDQIWGGGQEGLRLNLITKGKRKVIVSHYKMVYEDNTKALELMYGAVRDMENNDFSDVIGMVENKDYIRYFKSLHDERIGESICQN